MALLRVTLLFAALNLASVHAFSTAPCFLARPGAPLPLQSRRRGAPPTTCLFAAAEFQGGSAVAAAKAGTAAKVGAGAVAAAASSPAVEAAKAKGLEASVFATKTVTSPPEDSNFFTATFGSDSLLVTLLASAVSPPHVRIPETRRGNRCLILRGLQAEDWRFYTTLEATQGQILSQSPTDATRFWWHLYGS